MITPRLLAWTTAAAVILAASLPSCAGRQPRPDLPPDASAVLRAQAEVRAAVESAEGAEADVDDVAFSARYNPAACDCPDWEIDLRGRWTRVHLEPVDGEATELLRARTEEAAADVGAGRFLTYRANGRLAGEGPPARSGMRYPVLALRAIELR